MSLWKWDPCWLNITWLHYYVSRYVSICEADINIRHDSGFRIIYSSHWLIVPQIALVIQAPQLPTLQKIIVPIYTVQSNAYLYEICVGALVLCTLTQATLCPRANFDLTGYSVMTCCGWTPEIILLGRLILQTSLWRISVISIYSMVLSSYRILR